MQRRSNGEVTNYIINGQSVAVIFKSFGGYVLNFQKEIAAEDKKTIMEEYESIKDKNDGVFKIDNCVHRSDNTEERLVPTCCSVVSLTGFVCHKIGIFNVTPEQCGPCSEFQQK